MAARVSASLSWPMLAQTSVYTACAPETACSGALNNSIVPRVAAASRRADASPGDHQRMANVVAIADVGELHSARGAKLFLEREEIGERLAGMIEIRERIDDRNAGMCRQGLECFLRKHARHNPLHPARKTPRDIGNRFALAQMRVRVVEENGRATQARNADLKGDTRAQRRFFKNHGEKPASEGALVTVRMGFDVR